MFCFPDQGRCCQAQSSAQRPKPGTNFPDKAMTAVLPSILNWSASQAAHALVALLTLAELVAGAMGRAPPPVHAQELHACVAALLHFAPCHMYLDGAVRSSEEAHMGQQAGVRHAAAACEALQWLNRLGVLTDQVLHGTCTGT